MTIIHDTMRIIPELDIFAADITGMSTACGWIYQHLPSTFHHHSVSSTGGIVGPRRAPCQIDVESFAINHLPAGEWSTSRAWVKTCKTWWCRFRRVNIFSSTLKNVEAQKTHGEDMGMGQNLWYPSEHQNRWDLWMFIHPVIWYHRF